ncbi:hypothetical protein [Sporosarcina sp. FSL K6-1508]|uniref:hypothetical protein n=1 Tax=Sporosarcina sp. FSL K6-1508 TaxID=2921553 RepID=UPI0030FA0538
MSTATITLETRINDRINGGKELFIQKLKELEVKINKRKLMFIQKMKEQNLFVEHCPKRGFIYRVVQSVDGYITRVTVSWKNGYLTVLDMEPAEEAKA